MNLEPVLVLYLGLRDGSISDGEVSRESRLCGHVLLEEEEDEEEFEVDG